MTTAQFTLELFCHVDDAMKVALPEQKKHAQALLYPSEVVTLGMLFALKGVGNRAFYRWLQANFADFFPHLPERTRLFRLLAAHQDQAQHFLAKPSLLGVVDSYGIELIHPRREGRSHKQIGKKGKSNLRWIVGAKLCYILDHLGRVVDWAVDTANVYDGTFHPLIEKYDGQMLVLGDSGFHIKPTPAKAKPKLAELVPERKDPANLKICPRGTWNDRMVIETVLSMLTGTCHLKKVGHRVWSGLKARLAFTLAAFNVCSQWNGLQAGENGFVALSLLEVIL